MIPYVLVVFVILLFTIDSIFKIPLIVIGLPIIWYIGRVEKGANTFLGWGTKLYGEEPTTSGYIATKWIIIYFVPLIPVQSWEVFYKSDPIVGRGFKYYEEKEYLNYRPLSGIGLHWPQVFKTLITGWAIVGAIYFVLINL